MAPGCDFKKAQSNVGAHDLEPNWCDGEHYHGSIPVDPVEERNTFLPYQKDPVNGMQHHDIVMAHLSRKQKSPPVPRTVHDVGYIVSFCDFAGCINKRH
jgi:hypothetical protein